MGGQTARDLVLGEVRVQLAHIHQCRERDHRDADLCLELAKQVLGVERSVERATVKPFTWPGVIPADDQVRAPEVASNDRVPQGFPRPGHAHRERQQGEHRGVFRVAVHQRLVAPHPGVVVDVAGLRHADHRVDEQLRADGVGRAQRQLLMDAVHRIAGLKPDDP